MKVQFKVSPTLTIEFEADTQRSTFEELAATQEVFGESSCGKCEKSQLKYIVRTDKDDNKYYELRCLDCYARLSYGCYKKGGGLFPKRKDGDTWLNDKGWLRWDRNKQENV
jgi:formate dehydrogenase assembly factor FdhD